eukprot:scaffold12361_cov72-Cyclotella_meneghiniana.AAC.2
MLGKARSEVEEFQIGRDVAGIFGANYAVPKVIDEISADGNADTVGIFFLGTVVYYYSCICHRSVFRYVFDLLMIHEEDSVGALGTSFVVTLRQATEFFSKGGCPYVLGDRILCQFLIFVDCFSSDGMDNRIGQMLKIGHERSLSPCWHEINVALFGLCVEYKCL